MLAQVRLQELVARSVSESADGLLFDLANALSGKVKLSADFFECKPVVHADAEEQTNDLAFFIGERAQ